jgi:hypothetical protein
MLKMKTIIIKQSKLGEKEGGGERARERKFVRRRPYMQSLKG